MSLFLYPALIMHFSNVILFAFPLLTHTAPTIKTTSGHLRGISPRPNIDAYLGIPYAQPPLGDLRFAPPKPYSSSAVRECYYSSPGCFQIGVITAFSDRETGTAESEDMLSINIVRIFWFIRSRLTEGVETFDIQWVTTCLDILVRGRIYIRSERVTTIRWHGTRCRTAKLYHCNRQVSWSMISRCG